MSPFSDLVKQFAPCAKLCYQIKTFVILEDLIQPDDIWMVQVLHDIYLGEESLLLLGIQRIFFNNFNSSDYTTFLVRALSYLSETSSTELRTKRVLISEPSLLICYEIVDVYFELFIVSYIFT